MSRILPVMPVYVLLFLALVSGRLIHPLCPVSFVIRPKPQYISSIYLSHTNLVRALENSATRFIFSRQKLPCRIWSLWVKLWGRTVHMWSEKKCERWAPPFWVEERDWSPRNIPSHTWITGANLVAVNQTVGAQNLGASETCIPALLWRGASDSRGNTPLTTWVTMPNLIAVVKRHEHTYGDPLIVIMPPPLIGGALSDDDVWRLSVWRLSRRSVAYIGPNSRREA